MTPSKLGGDWCQNLQNLHAKRSACLLPSRGPLSLSSLESETILCTMEPGQHIQEGKQVTDQFKLLKQNLLENKAAAKNRKQKWFHTIQ